MKILCAGDSMTHYEKKPFDPTLPSGSCEDPNCCCYPKQLGHLMAAHVDVFSEHGDYTASPIVDWTIEAVKRWNPDIVVVQGGGDDLDNGGDEHIPTVMQDFERCYDFVVKQRGKVLLLLLTPYEHKRELGKEEQGERRRKFNGLLREKYADNTLEYHHILRADRTKLIRDDDRLGVHPTLCDGNRHMAELVRGKLKEMLAQT